MDTLIDHEIYNNYSNIYEINSYSIEDLNLPVITYFFGSLFLYYWCYQFLNYVMKKNFEYQNLEQDRKNYFLKNMVKTIAMVGIAIHGVSLLFNGIIYGHWDNRAIYILGYQYSALDVMGLIMVRRLPINSKIHHVSSFVLSVLNTFIDYNQPTFWIGLPVYCILSCFAFLVNMYLGLRLIVANKNLWFILNGAYFSYIILFTGNWIFQLKVALAHVWTVGITYDLVIYFLFILFLAYDDIRLLQFLQYHRNKRE
jgi:hypothetical protein